MKLGIGSLLTDFGLPPAETAQAIEAAGFDALWVGDHTHIPAGMESVGEQWWEVTESYWHNHGLFVSMAAAVGATSRLKVASGLCLLTERDPIVVAKETASLDLLSGGRLIFGVGAGWNQEELANHGTKFSTRWRLLRERTEAVRAIWTEERAEFHGKMVDFDPLLSSPKPVQKPHPPIVVGGNGPKSMELAVALDADWMPMFTDDGWPEVRAKLDRYRELVAATGRDPGSAGFIPWFLEPPAEEIVAETGALGASQGVIDVSQGRDHDEYRTSLERLAERYLG